MRGVPLAMCIYLQILSCSSGIYKVKSKTATEEIITWTVIFYHVGASAGLPVSRNSDQASLECGASTV